MHSWLLPNVQLVTPSLPVPGLLRRFARVMGYYFAAAVLGAVAVVAYGGVLAIVRSRSAAPSVHGESLSAPVVWISVAGFATVIVTYFAARYIAWQVRRTLHGATGEEVILQVLATNAGNRALLESLRSKSGQQVFLEMLRTHELRDPVAAAEVVEAINAAVDRIRPEKTARALPEDDKAAESLLLALLSPDGERAIAKLIHARDVQLSLIETLYTDDAQHAIIKALLSPRGRDAIAATLTSDPVVKAIVDLVLFRIFTDMDSGNRFLELFRRELNRLAQTDVPTEGSANTSEPSEKSRKPGA